MFIVNLFDNKRNKIPNIGNLGEIDKKVLLRIINKTKIEGLVKSIDETSFEIIKEMCWLCGENNLNRRKGTQHKQIYFKGCKHVLIHRLMYHNFIEDVPLFDNYNKTHQINHKCSHENNGRCINPWHMYLGSNKSNLQDSKKEKTFSTIKHPGFGEKHHLSRFTNEQISEIKEMRNNGHTYKDISEKMNISPNYASQICRGYRRSIS